MKISVTQADIDNGFSGDSEFCPVALAIKRFTKSTYVSVGSELTPEIYVALEDGHHRYRMPKTVRKFVTVFDMNGYKTVKPFNFILKETNK